MQLNQSNFNLQSPGYYLARKYLIATVSNKKLRILNFHTFFNHFTTKLIMKIALSDAVNSLFRTENFFVSEISLNFTFK